VAEQLRISVIPRNPAQFRKALESELKKLNLRADTAALSRNIKERVKPKLALDVNATVLRSNVNKALKNQIFKIRVSVDASQIRSQKARIQQGLGKFSVGIDARSKKALENIGANIGSLKFRQSEAQAFRREAETFFAANPVKIPIQLVERSNLRGAGGKGLQTGQRSLNTIVSDLNEGLDRGTKQTSDFTRATRTASKEVGSFAERIGFTTSRFAAYLIPATAIFQVSRAFQIARENVVAINKDINRLTQVFQGNASAANQVADSVFEAASRFGQSGRELLDISVLLAQSGRTFANQSDITNTINALSQTQLAATFGDINNVTQGLIASLNQFNLAGQETTRVLDVANSLSKSFAFEAENLFTAVKTGGAAFAAAGGQFEEFGATIAAIREITRISPATIGTGLNTIALRLLRPDVIQFLEQFTGGAIRDAEGNLRGVTEILLEVGNAARGLNEEQLGPLIERLSGIRQGKLLIPLIQDIAKGRDSVFRAALDTARTSSGSLGRDAIIGLERIETMVNRVGAEFQDVFRNLSENQGLKDLIEDMASLAIAVSNVADQVSPVLPLLVRLAGIRLGIGLVQGLPAFIRGTRNVSPGPFNPGSVSSVSRGGISERVGGFVGRNFISGTRRSSFNIGGVTERFRSNVAARRQALNEQINRQSGIQNSIRGLRNQRVLEASNLLSRQSQEQQRLSRLLNIQRANQVTISGVEGTGRDRATAAARQQAAAASQIDLINRRRLETSKRLEISNRKILNSNTALSNAQRNLVRSLVERERLNRRSGRLATAGVGALSAGRSLVRRTRKFGRGLSSAASGLLPTAGFLAPLAVSLGLERFRNNTNVGSVIGENGQLRDNFEKIIKQQSGIAAQNARVSGAQNLSLIGGLLGAALPPFGPFIGAGVGALAGGTLFSGAEGARLQSINRQRRIAATFAESPEDFSRLISGPSIQQRVSNEVDQQGQFSFKRGTDTLGLAGLIPQLLIVRLRESTLGVTEASERYRENLIEAGDAIIEASDKRAAQRIIQNIIGFENQDLINRRIRRGVAGTEASEEIIRAEAAKNLGFLNEALEKGTLSQGQYNAVIDQFVDANIDSAQKTREEFEKLNEILGKSVTSIGLFLNRIDDVTRATNLDTARRQAGSTLTSQALGVASGRLGVGDVDISTSIRDALIVSLQNSLRANNTDIFQTGAVGSFLNDNEAKVLSDLGRIQANVTNDARLISRLLTESSDADFISAAVRERSGIFNISPSSEEGKQLVSEISKSLDEALSTDNVANLRGQTPEQIRQSLIGNFSIETSATNALTASFDNLQSVIDQESLVLSEKIFLQEQENKLLSQSVDITLRQIDRNRTLGATGEDVIDSIDNAIARVARTNDINQFSSRDFRNAVIGLTSSTLGIREIGPTPDSLLERSRRGNEAALQFNNFNLEADALSQVTKLLTARFQELTRQVENTRNSLVNQGQLGFAERQRQRLGVGVGNALIGDQFRNLGVRNIQQFEDLISRGGGRNFIQTAGRLPDPFANLITESLQQRGSLSSGLFPGLSGENAAEIFNLARGFSQQRPEDRQQFIDAIREQRASNLPIVNIEEQQLQELKAINQTLRDNLDLLTGRPVGEQQNGKVFTNLNSAIENLNKSVKSLTAGDISFTLDVNSDIQVTGFENAGKDTAARVIVVNIMKRFVENLDNSDPSQAALKDKFNNAIKTIEGN